MKKIVIIAVAYYLLYMEWQQYVEAVEELDNKGMWIKP